MPQTPAWKVGVRRLLWETLAWTLCGLLEDELTQPLMDPSPAAFSSSACMLSNCERREHPLDQTELGSSPTNRVTYEEQLNLS